jgi:hypothetical protein
MSTTREEDYHPCRLQVKLLDSLAKNDFPKDEISLGCTQANVTAPLIATASRVDGDREKVR